MAALLPIKLKIEYCTVIFIVQMPSWIFYNDVPLMNTQPQRAADFIEHGAYQ